MELGDFPDPSMRALTIEWLTPVVTSVGMSLSELHGLAGTDLTPEAAALSIAEIPSASTASAFTLILGRSP